MDRKLITTINPDDDNKRINHAVLPYTMFFCGSDGKRLSFYNIAPGYGSHTYMPDGDTQVHQHDYFELFYIFDGEVYQNIEGSALKYKKGDACFMNKNIRHFEYCSSKFSGVFLNITPKYLADIFAADLLYPADNHSAVYGKAEVAKGPIREFILSNLRGEEQFKRSYLHLSATLGLNSAGESSCPAEKLLDDMAREMLAQKSGADLIVKGLLARFISILEDPKEYHITHMKLDNTNEDFIYARILNYISEKKGNITRPELARALNYHDEYLNRIVKAKTGESIIRVAKSYRIAEAKRLLTETNDSISSIVQALGYTSRSHFYKSFEAECGMLPSKYREAAPGNIPS